MRFSIYESRVGLDSFSRDPIGFKGSTWNLYEYCDSLPTVKSDPLGWASCTPNWTGPCTLDNFRDWYRRERNELNTWLPKLKPCPCTLACKGKPQRGRPGCPDHKICPTPPPGFTYLLNPNTGNYHPGTVYELRENNCPDDCQPGNQCTYDADGNLLTDSPGAGSSDRYSGGCGSFLSIYSPNHVKGDKEPYDCAKQLDPHETLGLLDVYEEVRPTNGAAPCAPGPWSS